MMNKYKLYCAYIIILMVMEGQNLWAQSGGDIYNLYRQNRIVELDKLRKSKQLPDDCWKAFVDAVFEIEASISLQKMIVIYSRTNDNLLKKLIRLRVSKCYYAQGYYQASERILSDEAYFIRMMSISRKNVNRLSPKSILAGKQRYGVQIGAYRSFDNAMNVLQKYKRYFENAVIIDKIKGNKKLYVVLIGGYHSRKEATTVVQRIDNQFNAKGYIVQY